jgi:hypothetical protein
MKNLMGWMLAGLLGMSVLGCTVGTDDRTGDVNKGGQVKLLEKNDGSCTIDIIPGIHHYYMGNYGDCQNDEYYSFQLLDVKSAVWVLFGSEDNGGKCPENTIDGWVQEVKTIKNDFSGTPIKFEVLAAFQVDDIVEPGIRKTFAFDEGLEHYDGRLSCVSTFWCPASGGDESCTHDPRHIIEHLRP